MCFRSKFISLVLIVAACLAMPDMALGQPYAFSVLEGDLAAAYPLVEEGDNFAVHYQPNSFAARDIKRIVAFIRTARTHINSRLGTRFQDRFDVYLANAFFTPPAQALRGRAFSDRRRVFILYDGSGSPAERRYMLAHELTHMIAWNSYARPKSAMLSEGTAVFAGEAFLTNDPADAFISLRQFCLAYRRAGRLPLVSSRFLQFDGHLYSLDVYYASGCFARYLIETYGTTQFGRLYGTLNYNGIYGKPLKALEREWLDDLDRDNTVLPFPADQLTNGYESLLQNYKAFFTQVGRSKVDLDVYRTLDQRRLSILRGRIG